MAKFEGQERRMPKIEACLAEYGWKTLEDADALCKEHGINVEEIVKGVQPIAFENACWAYTPVSYTHLEVYKRQGRCRYSRSGRWSRFAGSVWKPLR